MNATKEEVEAAMRMLRENYGIWISVIAMNAALEAAARVRATQTMEERDDRG